MSFKYLSSYVNLIYNVQATMKCVLLCNRSFLSQLKKLQAVVGVPSGATGIMQRVTAKHAQTGTCIMVCLFCIYLPILKHYLNSLQMQYVIFSCSKATG